MLENLPSGECLEAFKVPTTYGIYEYILFWDELILRSWDVIAHLPLLPGSPGELGAGVALVSFTLATRVLFLPLTIYQQIT